MQVENGATLSSLDMEQMTPVGRAMERGAKKSAQYLLQIGKFPCKPNSHRFVDHIAKFPLSQSLTAYYSLLIIANEMKGSVEELMYNVDIDGSSLLHLAVNSGVLGVRITV